MAIHLYTRALDDVRHPCERDVAAAQRWQQDGRWNARRRAARDVFPSLARTIALIL